MANRLLTIALILLGVLVFSGCDFVKKPGTLIIKTDHEDLDVLLETANGQEVARGATTHSLDPGTYRVKAFANGYKPLSRTVSVSRGQTAIVNIDLEPLTKKGYLSIDYDLPDGAIFLDDAFYGFTRAGAKPAIEVSPGQYNLKLTRRTFVYEEVITIKENEVTSVDVPDTITVKVVIDRDKGEVFYWHDKNPANLDYPVPKSVGEITKTTLLEFSEEGIYWFYAKSPGRVFTAEMVVLSKEKLEVEVNLTSAPVEQVRKALASPLLGRTFLAPWELEDFVRYQKKANPHQIYIAKYYLFFGNELVISGDLAYAQSMHETAYFKFGGDVLPEQNNYAGIGAVGGGARGHSFNTPEEGVLGQFQHLWAYAKAKSAGEPVPVRKYSAEPVFWTANVDPRYHLVTRAKAPTLSLLAGSWATDQQYAHKILKIHNDLLDYLGY